MAPLTVDPASLDGAGSAVVEIGTSIGQRLSTLVAALSGQTGMAGNDPVGAVMGRAYDTSADALIKAIAAAGNGLTNIGAGVRMSAYNYSAAEAQSDVAGRSQPLAVPPATGKLSVASLPSAVGTGVGAPPGFGWVTKYIGMIWPNGDSARLREAAAAWTAAGTELLATETSAAGPLGIVGAQQIPEGEMIGQAFSASVSAASQIMAAATTVSGRLTAYAGKVDTVHAAIIDLLAQICDPLTGIKMVLDFLTDDDENEIKKIADDIKTVVDNFEAETAALAAELAPAVGAVETVISAMGSYADKEWNQFLHGTPVGEAVNFELRVAHGMLAQAGGLVEDGWTYGPLRAMVDPQGSLKDWKALGGGMAPLVGLGGDDAPGVGETWKNVGKQLTHWDEWSTDPGEALGRSVFDIGSLFVPGAGEAAAAARGGKAAVDAAEAAIKAAPHSAEAARGALPDVAMAAEPKSAPVGPAPVGPTESRPPAAPGGESPSSHTFADDPGEPNPLPPLLVRQNPYETTVLDPEFVGEHHSDGYFDWTGSPGVEYLDEVKREELRITIRDGLLYDARGMLFDTADGRSAHNVDSDGRAIFVMDEHGNLYASLEQRLGYFHHSSFFGGNPVAAAGELIVKDGRIELVTDHSGHYQPGRAQTQQLLDQLASQGVTVDLWNIDYWAPSETH